MFVVYSLLIMLVVYVAKQNKHLKDSTQMSVYLIAGVLFIITLLLSIFGGAS